MGGSIGGDEASSPKPTRFLETVGIPPGPLGKEEIAQKKILGVKWK